MAPIDDPKTGVQCKDTIVSPEKGLSARLFLPKVTTYTSEVKFPLALYIHGGAFCVQSPFSPQQYNHLVSLVNKGNIMVVAIQYRRAPEHPLPIAYEDSWEAIKWVASHANGDGPEAWLNEFADFGKVFLAGGSAGANIAHNMAMKVGVVGDGLLGINLAGMVLVHPYFGHNEPSKFVEFFFPSVNGCIDPMINPVGAGVDLGSLGCTRLLVCVAGEDFLKERGLVYCEALKRNCGWGGKVELFETEGEGHVFHMVKPDCESSLVLLERIVSFINQDQN